MRKRLSQFILRHALQIGAVLFWFVMVGVIYAYMDANQLTFNALVDQIETTIRDHWFGPLIFLFIFVVLRPFTLIPAIVLAAMGGHIFGLKWGFIWGMIGKTLSAVMPYYFGRLFNTDDTPRAINTSGVRGVAARVERFLQENTFESLLAMRLVNVPFDIVSFMAGYMSMSFKLFMLATFLGNLSSVYGFAALGASLEGNLVEGDYSINQELAISSVIVLALSAVISVYLRRRAKRE